MTKIMSQRDAQHVAAGKYVLVMNSPDNETDAVRRIREEARDCLYFEFHDIFAPRPGLIHPERSHVERALEWGKDKNLDRLICVCQAGISRSSAMAYILNAQAKGAREAIKVLTPHKHYPNPLIVRLAAEILGDPEILQVYKEYTDYVDGMYHGGVDLEIIEHKGQEEAEIMAAVQRCNDRFQKAMNDLTSSA